VSAVAKVVSNAPAMTRLQSLALRLATMPMITGLFLLGAWMVFAWQPLVFMGYGVLCVGVLAALFVPFLLLRSWPDAPNLRNTVMVSLLAVANVPVAFFCVVEGVMRTTRMRVTIQNDADSAWQSVQLVGGGIIGAAKALSPNAQETRDVWAKQDGRLELHYIQDDLPCRVIVSGYVTSGLGGEFTVVRDVAGVVTVLPE